MKFFRVAREGKTVDRREITAQHIDEMAESYSANIYSARVWLEHFRGLFPDSPFKALGDVLALKADTDETGKRVLLAAISPTAELVKMNQERQKIFTSIELDPNFSDTGKAYLTGLAVTDSPASTGTEALAFNVCKNNPDSLFSTFAESQLNFHDSSSDDDVDGVEEPTPSSSSPSFLDTIKNMFKKQNEDFAGESKVFKEALKDVQKAAEFGFSELQKSHEEKNQTIAELKQNVTDLESQFAELKAALDETPAENHSERPTSTGGEGEYLTDC